MSERDLDAGTVDWLDLGPDPDHGGTPRHPGSVRWWCLLVVAMAVAALLIRNHHVSQPLADAAHPSRPALATQGKAASALAARPLPEFHSLPPGTGSPLFGQPAGATAGNPAGAGTGLVTVRDLGHPLLKVPADWQLIGQGPGVVVRIELARGRITRTSVPEVGSSRPIFLVVGQDRVLVHPMDLVPGYVVRDGKPAGPLPPAFDQAGSVLPGPDPWHVWAETQTGTTSALSLLTFHGRPAGVQIPIPKDATVQASDHAGNVLMFGIGGMYDLRADGMHRITSGTLLAVGPTRWLTLECDQSYRCQSVVIDRATGARHPLKSALDSYEQNGGAISPDGRTAALLRPNDIGASNVHLLDLATGADRLTGVTTNSDQTLGGRTFVWSPDSRWLFVTNGAGRLLAIDRAGRAIPLRVPIGPLDQLALRTAPR